MPLPLPPLHSAVPQKQSRHKNKTWREFFRSDQAILILCISVAFVFWLTTKLAVTYRTRLQIPIKYELPDKQTFRYPPPQFCEIDVQATGWELASLQQNSLLIPASDLYPHTLISAEDLQQRLTQNLDIQLHIHSLKPNQIELYLEPLSQKKVPISPIINISTATMYRLAQPPSLQPDSIIVSGPLSLLDTIHSWPTQTLDFSQINQNVRQSLQLRPAKNPQIELSHHQTEINIEIQQITEKQISLPVEIRNNSDSLLVALLPQTVTLTCIVGLNDYNKIQAADFQLFVTLPDSQDLAAAPQLAVQVGRRPAFVEIARLSPSHLTYLIKKIK